MSERAAAIRPEKIKNMKFNLDINGLRGLAILAVLLFHFRIPGFGGGFVGVDIFFVISGYLISNIILSKLQYEHFSLTSFFMHRIRRIVPALYAMLFISLIAGWWWLAPADYKELGKEISYASLFITNHLFARDSGYFATEAESKLLLHTWTLGVEWQFYILFPLLLLLIHRYWPKRLGQIICAITALSLGASVFGTHWQPEGAFYLLPARAWEFLIGTLLVLYHRQIKPTPWQSLLSLLGGFMLLGSITLFNEGMTYPGYWALVPTLGTALLIMTPGAPSSRLLASFPLQGLGTLSYSLYLWHWPLYVVSGYYLNGQLALWMSALLMGIAFLLGWLSYYLIETPFRQKTKCWSNRSLALLICCCALLLYPVGRWLQNSKGAPSPLRVSPQVLLYTQGSKDQPDDIDHCLLGEKRAFHGPEQFCQTAGTVNRTKIILWGDSHANAISDTVQRLSKSTGHPLIRATISSCPPLVRGSVPNYYTPDQCKAGNEATMYLIKENPGATVLIAARWSAYLLGRNEVHGRNKDMLWSEQQADNEDSLSVRKEKFRKALLDTTCALRDAGARVFILEPIPEMGVSVPSALARKAMYSSTQEIRIRRDTYQQRHQTILNLLAETKAQCGTRLLSPQSILCPGDYCQIEQEGRSLYFDDDHLSKRGAALLSPLLEQAIVK